MGIAILMGSGGGVSSDDVTATRNQLLSGVTAITSDSDDEPVEGTIASQAGGTFNPTTSVRTLATGGKYLKSDVRVNGFALPPASALKKGYKYTLYGQSVTGTFQGYTDSPLYIIQNGVVKNLSTNSFNNTTYVSTYGGALTTTGNTVARSNASINITDYKYLKVYSRGIDYSDNAATSFYIKVQLGNSSGPTINLGTFYSDTTGIFDISAYSGSYYIYWNVTSSYSYRRGIKDMYFTTT